MDPKILTLLVIGVAAIVIIAVIVVYQFAQQQYDIHRIEVEAQHRKNFDDCMAFVGNYTWCNKHRDTAP
jgi:hypothetical protein